MRIVLVALVAALSGCACAPLEMAMFHSEGLYAALEGQGEALPAEHGQPLEGVPLGTRLVWVTHSDAAGHIQATAQEDRVEISHRDGAHLLDSFAPLLGDQLDQVRADLEHGPVLVGNPDWQALWESQGSLANPQTAYIGMATTGAEGWLWAWNPPEVFVPSEGTLGVRVTAMDTVYVLLDTALNWEQEDLDAWAARQGPAWGVTLDTQDARTRVLASTCDLP